MPQETSLTSVKCPQNFACILYEAFLILVAFRKIFARVAFKTPGTICETVSKTYNTIFCDIWLQNGLILKTSFSKYSIKLAKEMLGKSNYYHLYTPQIVLCPLLSHPLKSENLANPRNRRHPTAVLLQLIFRIPPTSQGPIF